MSKNSHAFLGCFLFLVAFSSPLRGQAGLFRREDPQAGLADSRKGITNPEAADIEDEACLAKAIDMLHVQACDQAEIKRQNLRMEKAWDALTHANRPDMDRVDAAALFASQESWKKYKEATCNYVNTLYYPADLGKHENTCEWRMTRQRANELEILLKDTTGEDSTKQRPSNAVLPFPSNLVP